MCCLEFAELSQRPGFPAANPPPALRSTREAVEVWRLMGSRLDWAALPYVAEYLEVDNIEILISGLIEIKESLERKSGG